MSLGSRILQHLVATRHIDYIRTGFQVIHFLATSEKVIFLFNSIGPISAEKRSTI